MHHLRRKYRDPMSADGEFEPIMVANGLARPDDLPDLEKVGQGIDIMGIGLSYWRSNKAIDELLVAKARQGCRVRILLMHQQRNAIQSSRYARRNSYIAPTGKDHVGPKAANNASNRSLNRFLKLSCSTSGFQALTASKRSRAFRAFPRLTGRWSS